MRPDRTVGFSTNGIKVFFNLVGEASENGKWGEFTFRQSIDNRLTGTLASSSRYLEDRIQSVYLR